jgi:hypothetical protein
MIAHFLFFALYMVAISWSADGYHKRLKKITNLSKTFQHPNANQSLIAAGIEAAQLEMKKHKKRCYLILVTLFFAHELLTWINITKFGQYNFHRWLADIPFPAGALVISFLILQVIFWLKGKGGGIPDNIYMERMGTGL